MRTVSEVCRAAAAMVRQGWRPQLSVDASGVVSWPCSRCGRIHPVEVGACPPSDCDAARVCLDDAVTVAARFDVDTYIEVVDLLRSIAEPQAARTLEAWEAAAGRKREDVEQLLSRAAMRATAIERTRTGGTS